MNSDYRSIINSSFRLEVNIHMFMLPQWVIKLIVSWKIYWKIWIENNIIFYDYDHVKYNMKWLCYWKPWSDRIGQKLKRWQYDGLDHTLSLWVYLCCRLMNKKRSFYNCVRHVGFCIYISFYRAVTWKSISSVFNSVIEYKIATKYIWSISMYKYDWID